MRQAILDAPANATLEAQLALAYSELGEGPVAVRSSATLEDGRDHSFAGQHGTYFVSGLEDCLAGVKHCWASLWSEHAHRYRLARGLDGSDIQMAVVVQRLVNPDAAGVLFTADPLSGSRDRLVIESCFGLGEALVSGKVTPDRFVLARDGLRVLETETGDKRIRILFTPVGEEREIPLPRGTSRLPSIGQTDARRIAELGLRLERLFEAEQDVEWALAQGELFLLQSRPITAAGGENADRTVWSNVNSGEVLPDVASPMTWSFVRPLVTAIFDTIFSTVGLELGDNKFFELIAGRAYFNLTVLSSAIRRLPALGDMEVDELLGGARLPEEARESLGSGDVRGIRQNKIRMLFRVPAFFAWALAHSPSRAARFISGVRREVEAAASEDVTRVSERELSERLAAYAKEFADISDAIGFALVGFLHFSNLTALCRRWLDDDGTITNRLLAGLGNMASAKSGLDLWRLASLASESEEVRRLVGDDGAFHRIRPKLESTPSGQRFLFAWDEFMAEHGHHARGEIDLMNARWRERPDYILHVLRGYLQSPSETNPVALHERRAEEREALTQACRTRLRGPVRRSIFNYVLHQAQQGSLARENVKNEGVRWLAMVRSCLLELGKRLFDRGVLAEPDDIFFLTVWELEPVRRGEADLDVRAEVLARREEYNRNKALDPPPVFVGRYDPAQQETEGSQARLRRAAAPRVLTGLAASPGVAVGPARVILRTDSSERVLAGEILVAPFTDPGWTPYFMPAAGIIMDMGGMLSHGCIVARECGIPAVVNVGEATKMIRTGQVLRVDGRRGEVTVLDEDEPV
ncbi:MAG: hypothetical protein C4521_04670 [Actinobacteria bacterium]|nr:MAG: hypothetical protein C4521_04670 [Actinomycetota bacterium]